MPSLARLLIILGFACLISGCAARARSERAAAPTTRTGGHDASATQAAYRERAAHPAAALVFAPPVAYDADVPDLSRDERHPSAFVGYPEGVTEFFYVRWDDRQAGGWGGGSCSGSGWGSGGGWGDRYERRAISEKVGVLNR